MPIITPLYKSRDTDNIVLTIAVMAVLIALTVMLMGLRLVELRHRTARLEYRLMVDEGQIAALQDDDGDMALAVAHLLQEDRTNVDQRE